MRQSMNNKKSGTEFLKEKLIIEIAYANENEPIGYYGYGWAFYKSCGIAFKDELYRTGNETELKQWCLGFLAAMAEYPEFPDLKRALLGSNVDTHKISELCKLANDAIAESTDFVRLPPVI